MIGIQPLQLQRVVSEAPERDCDRSRLHILALIGDENIRSAAAD